MPAVPKTLTPRHRAAAMMRARGDTWATIAKEMRVSESTVWAWTQSEEWQALVEDYRSRIVDEAEGILIGAVPDVAKEMQRLAVRAESEHARVAAGKDILDRAGLRRPSKADETGITLRIRIDD